MLPDVILRIRPSFNNNNECLKVIDDNNLILKIPEVLIVLLFATKLIIVSFFKCSTKFISEKKRFDYSFTRIFEQTINQNTVFEEVGLPLVQDLLIGRNGK